jgi:hypothetical protein
MDKKNLPIRKPFVTDETAGKIKEKVTANKVLKTMPFLGTLQLRPKQIMFIYYYCANGFNATKAYRSAGYEANNAGAAADAMASRESVREGIRRYLEALLTGAKLGLENKIFNVLWNRAFYLPSTFVNPDGSPIFEKWEDIPEDLQVCIDSIETKAFGKDAALLITSVKLANREWALAELNKYIGMTKLQEQPVVINLPAEVESHLKNIFDNNRKTG